MNAPPAYPALSANVESLKSFLAAREFLLSNREDYETTYRGFRWPKLDRFNWALDYFDGRRTARADSCAGGYGN